jgi:hypothetical protein
MKQFWAHVGPASRLTRTSELDLIRDNLANPSSSRHLMLISQNQVANHILFGLSQSPFASNAQLKRTQRVEMLEGSLFEDDNSDHHVHILLHRVRSAMEEGIVLVITNLEILYESLYDVLNKNYTEVCILEI